MTNFEQTLVGFMKEEAIVDALTHGVWAAFTEADYEKVASEFAERFMEIGFPTLRDRFQAALMELCSKEGRDFQTLVARHPELGFRAAIAASLEEAP